VSFSTGSNSQWLKVINSSSNQTIQPPLARRAAEFPGLSPWQQVQGHQSTGPQDLPMACLTGNGFCNGYGAAFAKAAIFCRAVFC
jgi:hypothetical protein